MTTRLSPHWLSKQVSQPEFQCPTVDKGDQADLTAYLLAQQKREGIKPAAKASAKTIAAGNKLIEDLMLTHWLKPIVKQGRYTSGGLVDMLEAPAKNNPFTTFPDFRLSAEEAQQVAAAAQKKWGAKLKSASSRGNTKHGKQLYQQQCTLCHGTSPAASPTTVSYEQLFSIDWSSKGCAAADPGNAPDLRLDKTQRQALLAFSNSDRNAGRNSLAKFAPAEYAEREMKKLGCTTCHSGQNKLPSITSAGAKLKTEWLAGLLKGEHTDKIRPWMHARMPAFASRADQLAEGMAAMHGVNYQDKAPKQPKLAKTGEVLAGTSGYSCVLCHAAGDQPALQAFEGQGPNLALASDRLRFDYYQQWMHWPQRIAPATIMPRYTKDKTNATLDTHYKGEAAKQFDAIWEWMKTLK
jgi:mono/diheme cytochrome c family protein/cytochrome c551/c552